MRLHWWMLIVTAALAIAYLGWVFAARRAAIEPVEPQVDPEVVRRQHELDRIYGGKDLKILQFYAATADLAKGDHTVICYGVLNAESVQIEPPLDGVGASVNRCVAAAPRSDTRYTLTATGRNGASLTQSLTIHVHQKPSTPPPSP